MPPNSNMAVSEAKTSTAPVLLKESDITDASVAGRKPAELGKANLLFWQRFKRDRQSTARLMFTSNDAVRLVSISQIRVTVKHGMFLTFSLSFLYEQLYFFTK